MNLINVRLENNGNVFISYIKEDTEVIKEALKNVKIKPDNQGY